MDKPRNYSDIARALGKTRQCISWHALKGNGPKSLDLCEWEQFIEGVGRNVTKTVHRVITEELKSQRIYNRRHDEDHHWDNIGAVRKLCGCGRMVYWSNQKVLRIRGKCGSCGTLTISRPRENRRFCSRRCASEGAKVKRLCAGCGSPIIRNKRRGAKFCSVKCAGANCRAEVDEQAIISGYSTMGIRRLARQIGCDRQVIRAVLRRNGINPAQKPHAVPKNCWEFARKISGKPKLRPKSITVAQNKSWATEWKSVAKFDELEHWSKHPVALRWVRARAARKAHAKMFQEKSNAYLAKLLRSRTWRVLKGQVKSAPTLKLLGCDLNHFRAWIECNFQPGMTWENMGLWHLDHRLPCSAFNLSSVKEQRLCFHFSNFQPLWAVDNLRKSADINWVLKNNHWAPS